MTASEHLHTHKPALVVTNTCTMKCGGCLQFCGHFPKDKIFYVTPEQFRCDVEATIQWAENAWANMPPGNRMIVVYGGEPTIHPQWSTLVAIMREYEQYPFMVYTNGNGLQLGEQMMGVVERTDQDGMPSYSKAIQIVDAVGPLATRCDIDAWTGTTEAEFFTSMVNREKYPCDRCGMSVYEFVGLGCNADPGIWEHYITVFIRCKTCRCNYRFDTEQRGIGFSGTAKPDATTESQRNRLKMIASLPHRAIPQHEILFRNLASYYSGNIGYRIDFKHRYTVVSYNLVAVAPCDYMLPGTDFWAIAQKNCFLWNHCESAIYNGKAYFCEVAAAMDHLLFDGKHGWKVEREQDFLKRTDDEIRKQAEPFCCRCGYAFGPRHEAERIVGVKQFAHNVTIASDTNYCQFPIKILLHRVTAGTLSAGRDFA